MKEVNFKIIELPTHQVLVHKDFDDDDDEKDLLVIVFYLQGVKVKHNYGYENSEIRDKVFDEISESSVQELLNTALKIFKQ